MDELNQFLCSVEASARKILKEQSKKHYQQLIRQRAVLARGDNGNNSTKPGGNVSGGSNPELKGSTSALTLSGSLIVAAPSVSIAPSSPGKQQLQQQSMKDGAISKSSLPPINTSSVDSVKQQANSSSDHHQQLSPTTHQSPTKNATGSSNASLGGAQHTIKGHNGSTAASHSALPTISLEHKQRRQRATQQKILNSPLYKSLSASQSEHSLSSVKKTLDKVDHVNVLLKKMGLRHDQDPHAIVALKRADHSIEKRMCHACWSEPTKLTGCEHTHQVLNPKLQQKRNLELQGPTSWNTDDLFQKFRCEINREAIWQSFLILKAQVEQEELQDLQMGASKNAAKRVLPNISRHEIYELLFRLVEMANLTTLANTRKKNALKKFIFDVNQIWLTNLDHFNHHCRPQLHDSSCLTSRDLEPKSDFQSTIVMSSRKDPSATNSSRSGTSRISGRSTKPSARTPPAIASATTTNNGSGDATSTFAASALDPQSGTTEPNVPATTATASSVSLSTGSARDKSDDTNSPSLSSRILVEEQPEEEVTVSLSDRRDEAAIHGGYCQIQSISTARALQNAVLPEGLHRLHLHGSNSQRRGLGGATTTNSGSSNSGGNGSGTESVVLSATASAAISAALLKKRKPNQELAFCPLTLQVCVCGHWGDSLSSTASSSLTPCVLPRKVPGISVITTALNARGQFLWWRSPFDTPLDNGNYVELTQPVEIFYRNNTMSSSNAIMVSLVVALDAALCAPLCFAWRKGSKVPPPLVLNVAHEQQLEPELVGSFATITAGTGAFATVGPHDWLQPWWLWNTTMAFGATLFVEQVVKCRLDELLPSTILLLNPFPHEKDLVLELREPFGHHRFEPECQPKDLFRQWQLNYLSITCEPNFEGLNEIFGALQAQPNATGVNGRFCWHWEEPFSLQICRARQQSDYAYILHNITTSGSNTPLAFASLMSHEIMRQVVCEKLSQYLDRMNKRRQEAEYREQMKQLELKIQAGKQLIEMKKQATVQFQKQQQALLTQAHDRLKGNKPLPHQDSVDESQLVSQEEWQLRLDNSVVVSKWDLWQQRRILENDVLFYYLDNEQLPLWHRCQWDKPSGWQGQGHDDENTSAGVDHEHLMENAEGSDTARQSNPGKDQETTSRSDTSSVLTQEEEEEREATQAAAVQHAKQRKQEIDAMVADLLDDQRFLKQLKVKLGIASEEDDQQQGENGLMPAGDGRKKSQQQQEEEEDPSQEEISMRLDFKDKIQFILEEPDPLQTKTTLQASKLAKLQVKAFEPSRKPLQPGEGWKRLKKSHLPNNFARKVYQPRVDPPRASYVNQPNHSTPVGMIDPALSSQYELPEIAPEFKAQFIAKPQEDLNAKVAEMLEYQKRMNPLQDDEDAKRNGEKLSDGAKKKNSLFESSPDMSMDEKISKAVLYARNNNLDGLELCLDEGVEVNARDNHGNTLFILVCQQGNKRMVKFLLRRHADMNLQNLSGNTGLHYLIEYKHLELADYVKSKGADDTIQNAAGLTCYEGLTKDQVDEL